MDPVIESSDYKESRLTLQTVWDVKEGREINAQEFLRQPEGELVNFRRQLQIAITTNSPLFVCPHCHQMVKLCGRKTQRGKIAYFSHLYDSDACFIKTTTRMTKEQIEASKYGLISESERHKRLKAIIAESLQSKASREKGVGNVFVEKRINSPLPYMRWRRPDVQATFNNLNLVFEIQLSTTFVSTIVDRDIFYRLNNYYIIWVFNFEDNQEYVNLSNLMCKDIYYANKRNIFIFDLEAQQESIKREELILKCDWLDPANKWHFGIDKGAGVLVSLDQLEFDQETSKPYCFDADAEYYKVNPSAFSNRIRWEISREAIVRALIEKEMMELDLYQGQEESLRAKAQQQLSISEETATPFENKGKYGLKYKDVILAPPIYSSISEFNEYGYATVSLNRHVGLVDKIGNEVIPCNANEIEFFRPDLIIYRKNPFWYLVGATSPIAPVLQGDSISWVKRNSHVDYLFSRNSWPQIWVILNSRIIIQQRKTRDYTITDYWGNKIALIDQEYRIKYIWFQENLLIMDIEGFDNQGIVGIYDYDMKALWGPKKGCWFRGAKNQLAVCSDNSCMILSSTGDIIVPLGTYDGFHKSIWDYCNSFKDYEYYLVYKGDNVGMINLDGQVIVSCGVYSNLIPTKRKEFLIATKEVNGPVREVSVDGLRRVVNKTHTLSGIISSKNGTVLAPVEYDRIGDYNDKRIEVIKDGKREIIELPTDT